MNQRYRALARVNKAQLTLDLKRQEIIPTVAELIRQSFVRDLRTVLVSKKRGIRWCRFGGDL